jgi:hypothetical protein
VFFVTKIHFHLCLNYTQSLLTVHPHTGNVLKLAFAVGTVFLVAVPIVAGAWLVGTSNQATGIITIGMGIVLAMFLAAVMIGSPPGSSGRSEPFPD